MQRVIDVASIDVVVLKSLPPAILVVAHGHVSTTGWTGPELSPWFYIRVPDDGIQDFDFIAQEPKGIVGDVVLPIVAELTIHRDLANYWGEGNPLKGVRVHAQKNTIEYSVEPPHVIKESLAPISGGVKALLGDPGALTLEAPKIPDDVKALLIGRALRVYKTGDMLTMDWQPNRFNIERAPADGRIVGIWFG
ncbi:I78 family peptidase inhibitor [Tardiphaga sp. 172_B4_N1_3]|uniref:I78 family peptidase inhibitor n=1 Tax=Tardiphaga sp. 172_B4_N1_3 TaxID=3240787 RepID=UPI003F8B4080